jgi:hypothetical protein
MNAVDEQPIPRERAGIIFGTEMKEHWGTGIENVKGGKKRGAVQQPTSPTAAKT